MSTIFLLGLILIAGALILLFLDYQITKTSGKNEYLRDGLITSIREHTGGYAVDVSFYWEHPDDYYEKTFFMRNKPMTSEVIVDVESGRARIFRADRSLLIAGLLMTIAGLLLCIFG